MKSVLATIRLFRPVNLLLGGMMVTVTAALVDALNQTDLLMKGTFVVMSFTAAANAFNDYRDLETDKINRTNRPLPRGDLAPETALILSILLFMIGTGISFTINTGAYAGFCSKCGNSSLIAFNKNQTWECIPKGVWLKIS